MTNRIRGLRVVSAFEAAKGLVVLVAGFGLLALVHQDLQRLAEELVAHTHLNPASRYPRIFVDLAGRAADMRLWVVASFAFAYAALRLAEAYGLWHGRRWAEWLAVASGGIYVPAEIYELARGPSLLKGTTLAVNVGIVAYMGWALWVERRQRHGAHGPRRGLSAPVPGPNPGPPGGGPPTGPGPLAHR